VIERVAAEAGSRLWQLERDFSCHYHPPRDVQRQAACGTLDFRFPAAHSFRQLDCVELNLLGAHQARNAAVALAVLDELTRLGWSIDEPAVRRGFASVRWPAR